MRVRDRLWPVVGILVIAGGALASGALAQSPSASPAPPSAEAGWTRQQLATTWVPEPQDELELVRYTIEPGAATPAMEQQGSRMAWVESGAVSVLLHAGTASQPRGSGDEPLTIAVDVPSLLLAGQAFVSEPGAVVSLRNGGDEPAIVLAAIVTADTDRSEVEVDPDASPEPAPRAPVVRRIVLTGPGMIGDRYRITIADRSGRVRGARVPGERELRFATRERVERALGEITIGPLALVGRNRHELLIRWGGSPCGPVVTVDVGGDLESIRVVDRTPGCDAALVGRALVLRLSGPWFDPAGIAGSRVRRR